MWPQMLEHFLPLHSHDCQACACACFPRPVPHLSYGGVGCLGAEGSLTSMDVRWQFGFLQIPHFLCGDLGCELSVKICLDTNSSSCWENSSSLEKELRSEKEQRQALQRELLHEKDTSSLLQAELQQVEGLKKVSQGVPAVVQQVKDPALSL